MGRGRYVDVGYHSGRKETYFSECYCWPVEKKTISGKAVSWIRVIVCLLPSLKINLLFWVSKLHLFIHSFTYLFCMRVYVYTQHAYVREQLVRDRSLLPLCGSGGLNSSHQGLWQGPLSNEPSCQSLVIVTLKYWTHYYLMRRVSRIVFSGSFRMI